MKKHLIFCIALVTAMISCVEEPQIYRLLTDEEAAAVPYRMGESIKMLDQDGDTLCFTVVEDTTFVTHDFHGYYVLPNAKLHFKPQPYFYLREVVLQSRAEDSCRLRCGVAPGKVVSISYEMYDKFSGYNGNDYYWRIILSNVLPLGELPTTTFNLGDAHYENVYKNEIDSQTGATSVCYYSEQFGLLTIKDGGNSLTLIP